MFKKKWTVLIAIALSVMGLVAFVYHEDWKVGAISSTEVTTPEALNAMWKVSKPEVEKASPKAIDSSEAVSEVPSQSMPEKQLDVIEIENAVATPTPVAAEKSTPAEQTEVKGILAYLRLSNRLFRIEINSVDSLIALESLSEQLKSEDTTIVLDTLTEATPLNYSACIVQQTASEYRMLLVRQSKKNLAVNACLNLGLVLSSYEFDVPVSKATNPPRIVFTTSPDRYLAPEYHELKHLTHLFGL